MSFGARFQNHLRIHKSIVCFAVPVFLIGFATHKN